MVAEVHPYSKLAIRVFFAGFKLWRQRRQVNLKIEEFLVTLSDVAEFFTKLDQNKLDDSQKKIVAQLLVQVNECGFFIYENLREEKSYFRTVTGLILNSVDDAITEYEKTLKQLQNSFQQSTQVNIQMKILDMSQSLQDIRTDVNFNDMSYAKGVRFQSSKQCPPNTGENILDYLTKWILDGEEFRLCILAESGDISKSAVAHSIAKRFEDINGLGSSFCFDKESYSNIHIGQVFPTIAVDLARHDSNIRKRLGDIVQDPSIRSMIDLQDQFDYFISRTVVHASRKAPVVIVLDGLDECGDEASRARFFQILCSNESLRTLPQNFKILLTLSSDSCVALNLRQSTHIKVMDQIAADSTQPTSDAWASIPNPRPSISGNLDSSVNDHPAAQQPQEASDTDKKFSSRLLFTSLKTISEILPSSSPYAAMLTQIVQYEQLLRQSESLILGLAEDTRDALELLSHAKDLELNPGQERICLRIAQIVKASGNLIDLLNKKNSVYKILKSSELTQRIPEYQKQLQELQTAFHIQTSIGIQLAVQKFSQDAAKRYEDYTLNLIPSVPGKRFYGGKGYEHRNMPQDVIDQFMEWILDPEEARIFLLIGPPGVGKSAAAHSVAQRLNHLGQLGSSFFFDSRAQTPVEISKVFPTIAKDLASFDSDIRKALAGIIRDHSIRDTTTLQDQFDHLITTTAPHLSRIGPIFIILDGLDEYNNEATREAFFDVLCSESGLRKLPSNFKIIITTTPDSHIAIMGRDRQDTSVAQLSATGLRVESTTTFKLVNTNLNTNSVPGQQLAESENRISEERVQKQLDQGDTNDPNDLVQKILGSMPESSPRVVAFDKIFQGLVNNHLLLDFQTRDLINDMTNALEFVNEISAGTVNDRGRRISEKIKTLIIECSHFLSGYMAMSAVRKRIAGDRPKKTMMQYQQQLDMLQSALHREIAVHTSHTVQQLSRDLADQRYYEAFLYEEEMRKKEIKYDVSKEDVASPYIAKTRKTL
ncbi:hypothetical protein M422DRAFT_68085 [Sphaerobolus stellatus SS14]|uniref:NACHT domain-containing protein n=1 Tax=Sphaerobolus stellatus (strain SS14) TaxID=990650 RepID=A0A0C9VV29_SPHS4|nr:hypothetical protein M422DRAFT_68085 [Sphaerobolus stellatus SS14]